MACTSCIGEPSLGLQGAFERDLLKATFATQTAWAAGLGAALGFVRIGALGAALIIGGGSYLLARVNEPELAKQAPIGQFVWMAVVAGSAVILERAIIGDVL